MMHIFEEFDQTGLDALEAEDFCEFDGMLFRKASFTQDAIQKLIAQGIPAEIIQTRTNHQSLISYGGSMEQQRDAASRITTAWLKTVADMFPKLYPIVIVETSPKEVLVSIRAIAR